MTKIKAPGARKAVFVECDHAIDDQVFLEPTPGHTPGHVCVHVKSGGKEAIMTGDIIHHPAQTAEPQWSSCFYMDPQKGTVTRRTFLERNADAGRLILAAHFPTPTLGTITSSGNAFNLKPGQFPHDWQDPGPYEIISQLGKGGTCLGNRDRRHAA